MSQLSLDLDPRPPSPPGASLPLPPAEAPPPDPPSGLLRSLEVALTGGAVERVLLVGRTRGEGRELLRQLALRGVGWVGAEPTTLRPLAMEIVAPELAKQGASPLDEFEEAALVDEALDRALAGRDGEPWRALSEGVGFREAVVGTVSALRLGGVSARRVAASGMRDEGKRRLVAAILAHFEGLLRQQNRVDTAGVLHRAVRRLAADAGALPAGRILLLPGLGVRGLAGRLVAALRTHGARPLPGDPVHGVEPPSGALWPVREEEEGGPFSGLHAPTGPVPVDIFQAAGIGEEVREVLRRVMQQGARWDEVEVITPDPVAYGSALHALAQRLEIPVTFAVGLPVERTRPGRVVDGWFRWIEAGFPSELLRQLLESGDLAPPGREGPDPGRLARRLRRLRVGWGRDRYLPTLRRALAALEGRVRPRWQESTEDAGLRVGRAREELLALVGFLEPVLEGAPEVRTPDGMPGPAISPGGVAGGLEAFLAWLPEGRGVDAIAARKVRQVLARLRETRTRRGDPSTAMAVVRGHLQLRVPPPGASGPLPWNATGGALHLSDLEHGGRTGRRLTFLVGLDADRVPGGGRPDPLLTDADRGVLAPGELPTTGERIRESMYRTSALIAGLRGRVTMSYAGWSAAEGRVVAPSTLMLQAFRLQRGEGQAGYEALREGLGEPHGALPREGAHLDDRDVWMAALGEGGVLREGLDAVRGAHPGLHAGMAARDARADGEPGPHHGLLVPRPELDPRSPRSPAVLSASALESLGTCGLRYLFRSVLGIRPPDDPDAEPDRWLDALRRGGLLHRVFEHSLREARAAGVDEASEDFGALALRILEEEARLELHETPAPGEAVRLKEMEDLGRDVRAFATLTAARGAPWVALELGFGQGGDPPVELRLPGGGTVRLRGAIDRVDRRSGGLVVVDYKTGLFRDHAPAQGAFNGGRRLQHLLYGSAVEVLMGEPVAAAEYQYPTPRGSNEVAVYTREGLAGGLGLVDLLLQGVAVGRFLPTEESGDCGWCDFGPICRVKGGRTPESPAADWAATHMATHEVFRERRQARNWGTGGEE
jgi:ATP-dependent helicase/nuclease subunit B